MVLRCGNRKETRGGFATEESGKERFNHERHEKSRKRRRGEGWPRSTLRAQSEEGKVGERMQGWMGVEDRLDAAGCTRLLGSSEGGK